jgi:hypothetical protein
MDGKDFTVDEIQKAHDKEIILKQSLFLVFYFFLQRIASGAVFDGG